jgi:ParB family transcriptional regulator, chromosome partitioning protein
MTQKKPTLGRGLADLLGQTRPQASNEPAAAHSAQEDELLHLPLDLLQRGRYQPRLDMRPESLADLVDSIRAQGVVQPIVVRPLDEPDERGVRRYEIIAGERRWRAAQQAGLLRVPIVVRDVAPGEERSLLEMALIENIQRENLNPIDEALAYRRLADDFQLTQEEIAAAVGKDRTSVANFLRLLKLAHEVRAEVASGALSMGHARALVALPADADQVRVARAIIARSLSVRDTEALVKKIASQATPREEKSAKLTDVHTRAAEDRLRVALGTRVRIVRRGDRGRVEIDFGSEEELIRIYEQITGLD